MALLSNQRIRLQPDQSALRVEIHAAPPGVALFAGVVEQLSRDGGIHQRAPGAAGLGYPAQRLPGPAIRGNPRRSRVRSERQDRPQILRQPFIDPEQFSPHRLLEIGVASPVVYDNKVPTYEFPEEAIKTYMYMYHYARNLENLYETPEDMPLDIGTPKNHLKLLIRNAVRSGKLVLNEDDSKKFLSTYRINVTLPHFAVDADTASSCASGLGYPVVMKIQSPDISHKSDVGGVALNLKSAEEVRKAFKEMLDRIKNQFPEARIDGVTIQKMITTYDYELIIGSKKDPTLGPVIIFGQGGTETEFFKDVAIGLPPLNQRLARMLIERTNVYDMLSKGFRKKPAVNLRLLDETLIRLSNMIVDFPEIKELDINPLVVSGEKVIALDARIIIDENAVKNPQSEFSHLIISPYPTRYIQPWLCRDGRSVLLRPIRPEDEPLEHELIAGLSPESSRFRFFYIIKDISHEMLSRFCNIDYSREIAIIAESNSMGKEGMWA